LSAKGKLFLKTSSPLRFNGDFSYDGYAIKGKASANWKEFNLKIQNFLHWNPLKGLTVKGYGKFEKTFLKKCGLGLKTKFGYTYDGENFYLIGFDENWFIGFNVTLLSTAGFSNEKKFVLSLINGNETLRVNLTGNKLYAKFNDFSIKRCNSSIENLKGFLSYLLNSKTISGKLKFKNLSIQGRNFTLGETSLEIKGTIPDKVRVKLSGKLKGEIIKEGQRVKGNIGGTIETFGKPLVFKLPYIDYKLEEHKFHSVIKSLNYSSIGFNNVEITGRINNSADKQTVQLLFGKTWDGFLKLNWKQPFIFLNLEGNFTYGGKPYNFKVLSHADKNAGYVEVAIRRFLKSYLQFAKKAGIYLLSSENKVANIGTLNFKGIYEQNQLKLNAVVDFNIENGQLTLTAPFLTDYNFRTGFFHLKALPFCVNYLYRTVLCTKNFEIRGKKGKIKLEILSREEFPVELQLKGEIGKTYDVIGNVKIAENFINSLINPYGFEIKDTGKLPLIISIKGKNPLKGLYVSSDTSFVLYSKYFYKPIRGYLNLSANSGEGNLFFGLQNLLTGEIYGTASLNLKFQPLQGNFNLELDNLPLRVYFEKFLSSYLTVNAKFNGTFNAKELKTTGRASVDGFVKVYSYKPPRFSSSKEKKTAEKNGGYSINYKIKLFSRGPVYIKAPNGDATVTYEGFVSNNGTLLKIFINFGRINLFGKEYVISRSSVEIENGKTYLDFHMTHTATERTIFIHIYGYLPVENLKLDIYSVPPAPKNEILLYLVSGGNQF